MKTMLAFLLGATSVALLSITLDLLDLEEIYEEQSDVLALLTLDRQE